MVMAAKDKTPAEKTAKKKLYKKPTADRLDDSDLAGVSGGGEDIGCSSPGRPAWSCKTGGTALKKCDSGYGAEKCKPGQSAYPPCSIGGFWNPT
jgi:hypothetical protein